MCGVNCEWQNCQCIFRQVCANMEVRFLIVIIVEMSTMRFVCSIACDNSEEAHWACERVCPLPIVPTASAVSVHCMSSGIIMCGDSKGMIHFWDEEGEFFRESFTASQDRVNCMTIMKDSRLAIGTLPSKLASRTIPKDVLRLWA